MRRLVVALAFLAGALLEASPANADVLWSRRATDPDDIPCVSAFYHHCFGFDVLGTGIRIQQTDDGRHYLIVRLRTHERHKVDSGYRSLIALDVRGDERPDRLVYLNNPWPVTGAEGNDCGVRFASPGSPWHGGVFRTRHHRQVATCRFPLWRFAPDKRPFRWRVNTDSMFPQPYPTLDHAPNDGWYP